MADHHARNHHAGSAAGADAVPSPLAPDYYAQRASAGLIIAEATVISLHGKGYENTPAIYNAAQVAAWRPVTRAVHGAGGRIFLQLWHVGRISHPGNQPGGALPVAPSAIRPAGQIRIAGEMRPFETPRALASEEIPAVVAEFAAAARNAQEAGFDGVELHGANGYLIEQFLRDSTNRRTDRYGGSAENRCRFALEAVEAVVKVWGADRVGIRISPVSPVNDSGPDSDPAATYGLLVERLNPFGLAYLHVVEGATQGPRAVAGGFDLQRLRRAFSGLYMANNGYDLALALAARRDGLADLVCFGRPFIANPDLVARLRTGAPLAEIDRDTLYRGGAEGYTDYPPFAAEAESRAGILR